MYRELIENTIEMYERMLDRKITLKDYITGRWITIKIWKDHARRMLQFLKPNK